MWMWGSRTVCNFQVYSIIAHECLERLERLTYSVIQQLHLRLLLID